MVSRATHYRQKARHDQRPGFSRKAPPLDESIWLSEGMRACRQATSPDNRITRSLFATKLAVDETEAERRLRYLTRIGYLNMAVERDEAGAFIGYSWSLRNRDLPTT